MQGEPKNPLFPEWSNEERIRALFACPMADEHSNFILEQDYFNFWRKAIPWMCLGYQCPTSQTLEPEDHYLFNCSLFITLSELPTRFSRDGTVPAYDGLQAVVLRMNRNQELLSFEQTEQWGLHFSPSRWVINSVVKPVAIWTWERISATGVPDRWIVMSVLQSVANRVYRYAIEHCLSPMERLFCLPVGQHIACASRTEQDVTTSFTVLCRSAAMNCSTASTKRLLHRLDETELVFIARYLVHVGRATIENNTFIRIENQERRRWQLIPASLGASANEILRLQHTTRNVQCSVRALEKQLAELKQSTRRELQKKNRSGALRHLRMVKLLEKTRNQRSDALLNLFETLEKLKSLQLDSEIISAYELATKTLRGTRARLGLEDIDKANYIIDDWKQCMDEQGELDKLIAEPSMISSEEELELEQELENLASEKEVFMNMRSLSELLPSVNTDQTEVVSTSKKISLESS